MSKKHRNFDNDGYWFCPRCGSILQDTPIEKNERGSYELQCSRKDCAHNRGYLLVHHPIHGLDRGPGDSWSISWVK